MKFNKIFDKKEIKNITIASLILGFIFSFKMWGQGNIFSIGMGLSNWLSLTVASAIVLLVYQSSHKIIAKKYGCKSTFNLWGIRRYWFSTKSKISNLRFFGKKFNSIKTGVILPLLLVFMSNGLIKFCAVGSSEISEIKLERIGKKFKHITDFDIATIHLVGPITILLLSLLLGNVQGLSKLTEIAYTLSIFSMIPFAGLDGSKIFFGSPALYILSIIFIITSIILINIANPLMTFIFSIIAAIIIFFLFLIRYSHLS